MRLYFLRSFGGAAFGSLSPPPLPLLLPVPSPPPRTLPDVEPLLALLLPLPLLLAAPSRLFFAGEFSLLAPSFADDRWFCCLFFFDGLVRAFEVPVGLLFGPVAETENIVKQCCKIV